LTSFEAESKGKTDSQDLWLSERQALQHTSVKERLITEVGSVQEKNEEKINREKHEICQLTSILKDNKQELEFLRDHGSNNQLFLTLRKQITNIQKTDKKIHVMTDKDG
jgi:ribonuclease HII